MNNQYFDLINQIFNICIIPLLGILTAYAVNFLKAKIAELNKRTQEIENAEHQALVQKYLDMAQETIVNCVIATNQTFVDSLKNSGEFTKEAGKKAFEKTYQAVLAILSEEAKNCLSEVFGDLNVYLKNQIEMAVAINKK